MDHSLKTCKTLFLSLLGLYKSKVAADNEPSKKVPSFDPERIIGRCFKQFKQEDFHLPQSRRRIITAPHMKEQLPVNPTLQPQEPPKPLPSFYTLEVEDRQEEPLDTNTWLRQRLKLQKELNSFGNTEKWLSNKPSLTPSEAKVLHSIHKEQEEAKSVVYLAPTGITKRKSFRAWRKLIPLLHLPKPDALSVMYSYLQHRKIKILEMFNKLNHSDNQNITREEFITALNTVGVPLSSQDMEDIVIYLSSLGKLNTITMDILASSYKQWSIAQQRRSHPDIRKRLRGSSSRSTSQHSLPMRQKGSLSLQSDKMDLLTVPKPSLEKEARPLSLEEMEDVGKRYRERKRLHKISVASIQYSECCRLVRSGNKHFDENCLPSTVQGDTADMINKFRRDNFLSYLKCWKLCESYGLPLTEDILTKALLYPGDKIIFLNDQVRPIRQPGGYYSDFKFFTQSQTLLKSQRTHMAKMDKKMPKKTKKLRFKEFEEFTRKLKAKRPGVQQLTHPNNFWPGHLLDKLRLYLPTVATDRSQALFSHVHQQPSAYPAIYHPNHWWPIRNMNYVTPAYYDAHKVYYID